MLKSSRKASKKRITFQLSSKDLNYQVASPMGHFLELRIRVLLKSMAFMFTSQSGGLDEDEKRRLGGHPVFRNNISSRKISSSSHNVQELGGDRWG